MVNWKKISTSFFALGILGILMSGFYSLVQMTAMYAPPDLMAEQSARNGQEFLLIATGIGILFVAGIVSFFIGRRQEESPPPRKEQ